MLILARNWWAVVLRGVVALLFGLLAFLWPGIALATFVVLFGAFAFVDGILYLLAAFRPTPGESRGALILYGILGVIAGIVVLVWPGLSAVVLVFVVAAWALLTGITEIAAAIALRKEIEGEWLLGIAGVLSVLLGVFLFLRPAAGILGLIWAIGAFAILAGIVRIVLGLRLRSWQRRGAPAAPSP